MSRAATATKRQTIHVAASAAQSVVMIGAAQVAFMNMPWYQRWAWLLFGRLPQIDLDPDDNDSDRKVA